MYYILFISQMSKLQFCSESNSAAIFQLNSLPGKIFFELQIGIFLGGNLEKRRIFWIGNGACFVCLFCCFTSQVNSYGHGGDGQFT